MNGFTFKNRHSSTFGCVVKTNNRPIIPSVKTYTYSAMLQDGEYDFTEANPYGREFYNKREMSVSLQVFADNLEELNRKVGTIASWLCGSGYLIFDDTKNVRWYARVNQEISYAPETRGKKAILTVVFDVGAFAEGVFTMSDGPLLDSDIMLCADMPLTTAQEYTINQLDSEVTEITLPNYGTRPIVPIIRICGENGTHTLSNGDLSISAVGSDIVFDFILQRVTQNNETIEGTGVFFEISDKLYFTSDTEGEYTVSIDYRPKCVWDLGGDLYA